MVSLTLDKRLINICYILTLGYLNPALNNPALDYFSSREFRRLIPFCP